MQTETDLKIIRDALGLDDSVVPSEDIAGLKGFLTARHQVAHDLDLRRPSDAGSGERHRRNVATVISRCNDVMALTTCYVTGAADLLRRRRVKK